MSENRDPKKCVSCGTVNPWLNETCRECGEVLQADTEEPYEYIGEIDIAEVGAADLPAADVAADSVEEPPMEPSAVPEAGPRRRRWNIRWILIGIFLHFMTLPIAEFAFAKFVIAGDPELKAVVEELMEVKDPAALSDVEKKQYQTRIFTDARFVFFVVSILLAPLFIGLFIGFFSKGILDGAAAMGISSIIYCFLINKIGVAFIAGPLNAGLGAAGAWGGYLLRNKIRND